MKALFAVLLLITIQVSFAKEAIPALKITLIEKGIYLHTSYMQVDGFGLVDSNGLVVTDGKEAHMIDTPWSVEDTEKLVNWIKAKGYVLKDSISTHSHADRVAGISFLNSIAIPTYASKLTNKLLKEAGEATASNTFEPTYWLVKDKIQAYFPGEGHTKDNLVIWLPESKILVGGCLVKSAEAQNLGYIGEASIDAWPASIDKLLYKFKDAKLVIPGHGMAGSIALLRHTKTLAESAVKK
ncbi:MAG: DIM/SIM/IMP family subclass B1 metallo-beta-lactamase [Methylophilaceae bacterium]